jgi:hypothetical protein
VCVCVGVLRDGPEELYSKVLYAVSSLAFAKEGLPRLALQQLYAIDATDLQAPTLSGAWDSGARWVVGAGKVAARGIRTVAFIWFPRVPPPR